MGDLPTAHPLSSLSNNSPLPCPPPTYPTSKSFWHTEICEELRGYLSSPSLPETADIVIVGAGITGANVARYLSQHPAFRAGSDGDLEPKPSIVLLDAREVCYGATGRNGGHCQPLLTDTPPDVARFELENCRAVKEYIEDDRVQCEYRPVDGCRSFWTIEEFKKAQHAVRNLREQDPDTAQKVDVISTTEELGQHWIRPGCRGATVTRGAASLWPYKMVTHMIASLLHSKSIALYTNTPVNSISPSVPPPTDGQPAWTLSTPRGNLIARHIILATNGYTSSLLPSFTSLIVPCRGTMTALLPAPTAALSILPNSYGMKGFAPNASSASDDYLIQRPFSDVPNPKGHLMFGGGKDAGHLPVFGAEAADDSLVDQATVQYLSTNLPRMLTLPGSSASPEPLRVECAWSGIMGFSRDALPWVGAVPGMRGLWLCAGYTGHGMPNATLCGRAVAAMVADTFAAEDAGASSLDEEGMDARLALQQEEMVRTGRLPRGYLLTRPRLERALKLPSVQAQEAGGGMDWRDGLWTLVDETAEVW